MHPDDVADHVAASVAELERRVERSGLPVTRLELVGPTDLRLLLRLRWARPTRMSAPLVPVGAPGSGAPGRFASGLLLPAGVQVGSREAVLDLSTLLTREVLLRFGLDDFDSQPPLAELLTPDGRPLPPEQWPHDPQEQGIVQNHPRYGRPFFCRPGMREFHEHLQHEDEPWDRYRERMTLHQIVLGVIVDLQDRFTFRR